MEGHVRGSVLVVDDEPTIREVVSRYLERAGYETRVAGDGAAALKAVEERAPDLIVLDLMLPGIDGLEVMRRVRDRGDRAPAIILLTAKGEENDRIVGLRLGADDYVVKPFSPGELVARVDAVLRRVDTVRRRRAAAGVRRAGDRPGRPPRDRRRRGGRADDARVRAAALPRPPSRPRLHAQRADGLGLAYAFYTDTSTVTVHIRRLRAKIERDASAPRWIETVWGVGYRFAP